LQSNGCGTSVPLEQGIYGAQKRTEQGIFVLSDAEQGICGEAAKALRRGCIAMIAAANATVAETISSIWKIA
jgi:hypothetical protein